MLPKRFLFLVFGVIVFVSLALPAASLAKGVFHVRVENLDVSQFPRIEAYVSVSDSMGLPIEGLKKDAFSLTEDKLLLTIDYFEPVQNTVQPLAIALIVDTSASMGSQDIPTPLQKSVDAAKLFVDELESHDQVTIIKFSEQAEVVLGLTSAGDNNVKLALNSLKPEKNKTALYDGIVKGANELKKLTTAGRRIIVVITDGKDTGTGTFDFDSAVNEANANLIPIYPIGFGSVIKVDEIKKMAERTGGVAHILPDPLELSNTFGKVLKILREQYLIRFTSALSTNNSALTTNKQEQEHELTISVDYANEKEQFTQKFLVDSSGKPITLLSPSPTTTTPGYYTWMIPLIVLAIACLIIPIAISSRRRKGKAHAAAGVPVMSSAAGQPVLRELEGMHPNQVWPLRASEIRLGRKRDENDIALKGLNASRRQASIRFEHGQYVIYNLSSNNPVLVNNVPVAQKQVLRPGDMIRLGETLLRFDI